MVQAGELEGGVPLSALELLKIATVCTVGTSVNCLSCFKRVLSNFEPIRKVWSVKILLALLAVGTLTILSPSISSLAPSLHPSIHTHAGCVIKATFVRNLIF